MPRVNTCISIDSDLKKAGQELYADLGLDLSTVVTLLIKESLRVQGLPFEITRNRPDAETLAAVTETYEIEENQGQYQNYNSFKEVMGDVFADA